MVGLGSADFFCLAMLQVNILIEPFGEDPLTLLTCHPMAIMYAGRSLSTWPHKAHGKVRGQTSWGG